MIARNSDFLIARDRHKMTARKIDDHMFNLGLICIAAMVFATAALMLL